MRRGRRIGLLVSLLVVVAVAAGLATRELPRREAAVVEAGRDIKPPGRWHFDIEATGEGREDLARVLSLPYSAGTTAARGVSGVVRHDPSRAYEGWNLYTSGHGPEAILTDMEGRPLYRWRYPFERAFPDKRPDPGTEYFRRAFPLPDGGILAIYQGAGLIRLDVHSHLVWAFDAGFYNDLDVGPDGEIYSITKEVSAVAGPAPDRPILEDFLVVLGPDGRLRRKISLWKAIADSPYAPLLEPRKAWGDVFHTNTVQLLRRDLGTGGPFRAGNLLVSLREIDLVAVIDPDTETAVWARRGPWRRQHEPSLLDDGHLLVFDNRGDGGNSRVLEMDPLTGTILWSFHGSPGHPFSSPEAGTAARLPNGDTLITESERGHAFELAPGGDVVWEMYSPHRAGPHDELVATLFEVIRLRPADHPALAEQVAAH